MGKSISVRQKKRGRGRPATGRAPNVGVRLPPDLIARVDYWATEAGTIRSVAIRRLLEHALQSPPARKVDYGSTDETITQAAEAKLGGAKAAKPNALKAKAKRS
jgi:hypothetical protein